MFLMLAYLWPVTDKATAKNRRLPMGFTLGSRVRGGCNIWERKNCLLFTQDVSSVYECECVCMCTFESVFACHTISARVQSVAKKLKSFHLA